MKLTNERQNGILLDIVARIWRNCKFEKNYAKKQPFNKIRFQKTQKKWTHTAYDKPKTNEDKYIKIRGNSKTVPCSVALTS